MYQTAGKYYNAKAVASITETLDSTVEDHCRKQVQMHAVATHITGKFNSKVPADFGECFKYNQCYNTKINDRPATIEEFVPGSFAKIINNNGIIIPFGEDADDGLKQILQKAECLVHHSHEFSNRKFMLLDIQGTGILDINCLTQRLQLTRCRMKMMTRCISAVAIVPLLGSIGLFIRGRISRGLNRPLLK
jgi:hypothetical protein